VIFVEMRFQTCKIGVASLCTEGPPRITSLKGKRYHTPASTNRFAFPLTFTCHSNPLALINEKGFSNHRICAIN